MIDGRFRFLKPEASASLLSTMLDVPAPITLKAPVLPFTTRDTPAAPVIPTSTDSPLLGYTAPGPSTTDVPAPLPTLEAPAHQA